MTISELVQTAGTDAAAKGFDGVDVPRMLCLIHSEVSEALEAYRENGFWYVDAGGSVLAKPEGIASELADVVIRVGDMCHRLGINLEDAILEKLAYNRTRPQRHGKRF